MSQNPYASSHTNLHKSQTQEELSPQVLAIIMSAGFWARLISWSAIIGLVMLFFAIIIGAVILFSGLPVQGIFIIIGSAIFLWLNWVIYSTMRDYARAASRLRDNNSEDPAEDVKKCFQYCTIYFKWVSIFTIAMFIIGIAISLLKINIK